MRDLIMKYLILILLPFCTSLVIAQSVILESDSVTENGILYERVYVFKGALPAIPCNELISALNANEARARKDYPRNQPIRIVDVARDINVGESFFFSSEVATVQINASDDWLNGCVAEMASLDEAVDLNKDESADLFCETWKESRGDVRFKNCTVIKQASRYEVNPQEPFTGVVERYYESGQLASRANYKAGVHDGLVERYYESGQLASRANYKAGVHDGLVESYYENGQLKDRAYYIAGLDDGIHESYYENGQLMYIMHWKAGKEDGLYEEYYESGKLKERANFKAGELVGIWETYCDTGYFKLRGQCRYDSSID
jgi:antitoxin component YwqK of YwqJK toxin-antitoxin module